ncbi:uncharacterized protein A4U43_C04F11950 [Asparagus officinalis]|uniref:Uncharacterized protein n=1 Tax=Asparagus officinalis TaxID=4686 RepID=A0A5P1F2W4_ASPOF|nr:myb-related protein Zm1-like [Asparagus officinalis]ONK71747.1 uncharacterized protein A4U43_C04F11950 [Asparagus officinalis]
MGRGRAPCCAKVGLNKGSWTPEEDMRLITYIHKYGHGNWRALPRLAGLLRCGKSCRLRWINYLRPDIKRGNFTEEEEDTIIKLHGVLGNKWSKIASCLPGRTDNEIKNVWNTHLKKRLTPKDRKSQQKLEEDPSSPSSVTTASVSCSDEGSSKTDKERAETTVEANNESIEMRDQETSKVEIPVEPNLDFWDVFQDCSVSDVGLKDEYSLADLPEIMIEPEILNMINDDLDVAANTAAAANDHRDHQDAEKESENWLAYLEKELDLWGESTATTNADVEGADPVASYFQALQELHLHL